MLVKSKFRINLNPSKFSVELDSTKTPPKNAFLEFLNSNESDLFEGLLSCDCYCGCYL